MDARNLTYVVVAVVLILAIVGVVAVLLTRRQRSQHLREQFGAEYERAVARRGDERRAEGELAAREERVEKLHIRALDRRERDRFAGAWRAVQARFVDEPAAAVTEADTLIAEVMRARGYPVGDFEQRAADVSVHHADVVSHYRVAHEIAARNQAATANTEDLRQAMVHYRLLFADLLEQPTEYREEVQVDESTKRAGRY